MLISEHETTINFDYEERVVRIYTTREGVYNGVIRRLGKEVDYQPSGTVNAWSFVIPMAACRTPEFICKLLNPDEKKAMTEAQKAALRTA
ncbi:MAG: hypothetical protein AAFR31_20000 [Cyanobacteria bacterium J06627_8]